MPADLQRAQEIALAARSKSGLIRDTFLSEACGEDAALRRQVEAQLPQGDESESYPGPGADTETPPFLRQTGPYSPASGIEPLPCHAIDGNVPGQIGPYRLLQKLGEGGMGAVYLAEQERPVRRRLALKLIKPGMDSAQVVARFEAERQALALMDHPNIAKVFDAGTTETGRPYFVMELVSGVPITRFCNEGSLSVRERLELFITVCQAIQHAHQKGIIHRDIKPSNVLVASADAGPAPKVIDFGVAKAIHQRLTEQTVNTELGSVLGTVEYMSPEQADLNALDVDTLADIYSLGVVLYELLTGSTPLDGKRLRKSDFLEMLRQIREMEPARPSTRLRESKENLGKIATRRKTEPARLVKLVRGDLDWIVMKALEKERGRRYETADALARDVERHLRDEPVEAFPPSAAYRLKKVLRRHRVAVLAGGAVVVALVAGIIGTSLGLVKADIARGEAVNAQRAEADQRAVAEGNEKRANTERDRAEEEASIAFAVRKFLQDYLLRQVDVAEQANQLLAMASGSFTTVTNPTVRELLDRAAELLSEEKIEEVLPKQRRVQAEILLTVGDCYRGVGRYETAASFMQRALDRYQSLFGPEGKETLRCRNNLAVTHLLAGNAREAAPLFEELVQIHLRNSGPNDRYTLQSQNNLATAYRDIGKLDQAIPLLQVALEAHKRNHGPTHLFTLHAQNNLATAYLTAGKFEPALALYKETLETQIASLGADHPDTLVTQHNLGHAYFDARLLDQALPLLKKSFKTLRDKLGTDHPEALVCQNSLGRAYLAAGKYDMAVPLIEQTRAALKSQLGADHPKTLTCQDNLAEAYIAAGKFDAAAALAEETHKGLARRLGAENLDTLVAQHNLAQAYRGQRKMELAVPLYEQTLKSLRSQLGDEHYKVLNAANNLALSYEEVGKLELAIPLMQKNLEVQKARFGNEHTDTLTFQNNLAVAYLKDGKVDRTIPLLEQTLPVQRAKLGTNHPLVLNTMNNLAAAYKTAGKPERAIPLSEDTLRLRKETVGPDHLQTLQAQNNLAANYQAAGQLDRAVPIYEQCLQSYQTKFGADHPGALNVQSNLGMAYLALGKGDRAAPLFEQFIAAQKKLKRDEHVETLNIMVNLARAHQADGKLEIAMPLYEQVFKLRNEKLGPDHPETLFAEFFLAGGHRAGNRLEPALPHFEHAYRGFLAKQGPVHSNTLTAQETLASVYEQMGKWDRQQVVLEERLATFRKHQPAEHPSVAGILAQLGLCRLRQQEYAAAEPYLRESLAIREKKEPEAWTTFNGRSLLGAALLGRKKHAEAEPLLLEGFEGMKLRADKIPKDGKVRLREAAERLVQLYDDWNKKELAAKWRNVLEKAEH